MQARQFGAKVWAVAMAGALGGAGLPAAADVAQETAVLGDYQVTLHLHPFLSEEDLSILRLVASDAQYLALFVPQEQGYSALAVSPDEGFVKDGVPVASAVALGGLPDAAQAAQNATEACQKAAQTKTPCVVILEVAPQ